MNTASTPAVDEVSNERRVQLEIRAGGRVLVCDGAMGTMLHAAGASLDRCLPELNLTKPEIVTAVHRSYVAAGADIIETNSFGANRTTMSRFGLNADVVQINRRSVELARAVADESERDVLIAGSIGPAAAPRPLALAPDREALEALVEQTSALEQSGVDLLMFETFGDLAALASLIEAYPTSLPIIAQVTFLEDGNTIGGDSPRRVAEVLTGLSVAAIGANCTLGPGGTRPIVEALAQATSLPLCVQPNAGPPTIVHGRFEYRRNEEYFARAARVFVDLGAVIVGGCCGTTPRHTEAIVRHLRTSRPAAKKPASVSVKRSAMPIVARSPSGAPTFAEKLARNEFVIAAELPSPDRDRERTIADATQLSVAGADTIVVAAPPRARASMSPISFGLLLRDRLAVDVVLTASTWDKSILGLQADLLGAHAFGLRSVICTTGVPPPQGDYPDLSQLFEVSSIELIETLVRLNQAPEDLARSHRATAFLVGARVNPSAVDREWELDRARRKVEAGVNFFVTDPVFSLSDLERFVTLLDRTNVPVLIRVTPLRDFEQAEYLHFEVPGVTIPDEVLNRMRYAGDEGELVGREITTELVRNAAGLVQGAIVVFEDGGNDEAATLLSSLRHAAEAAHVDTADPVGH